MNCHFSRQGFDSDLHKKWYPKQTYTHIYKYQEGNGGFFFSVGVCG